MLILLITITFALVSYTGDQVWTAIVKNEDTRQKFETLVQNSTLNIDLWTSSLEVGSEARFRVPRESLEALKLYELDTTVIVDDLQEMIDNQNINQRNYISKATNNVNFNNYMDSQTIHNSLKDLPLKSRVIGRTYENRDIIMYEIGAGKFKIVLNGGIHAREWITPMVSTYILSYLSDSSNNITKTLLDTFTFMVIPILNEDGYQYSWTTDRLWRKNRQTVQGSQCIGTDINRNFNYLWGMTNTNGNAGSKSPCDSTYFGPNVESSPEALALSNFLRNTSDIVSAVDIHSFSQLIIFPFGDCSEPQDDVASTVGKVFVDAVVKKYATRYKSGSNYY